MESKNIILTTVIIIFIGLAIDQYYGGGEKIFAIAGLTAIILVLLNQDEN